LRQAPTSYSCDDTQVLAPFLWGKDQSDQCIRRRDSHLRAL
jgi:hypothetical protein